MNRPKAMIAAINMNRGLETVNKEFADRGYAPLNHGIGIHSGRVVAANIGSAQRLSYALVGETVQLTVEVKDQNGSIMTGAAVTWTSTD